MLIDAFGDGKQLTVDEFMTSDMEWDLVRCGWPQSPDTKFDCVTLQELLDREVREVPKNSYRMEYTAYQYDPLHIQFEFDGDKVIQICLVWLDYGGGEVPDGTTIIRRDADDGWEFVRVWKY